MTKYNYGDPYTRPLDLKFNGGKGALLCDCGKIMANGFEHDGKTYECKCGSLHQIVRLHIEDDDSFYFYGALEY